MSARLQERSGQAARVAARAGVRAVGQQLVASVGAGPLVAGAAVAVVGVVVVAVVAFVGLIALLGSDSTIDQMTSSGPGAGAGSSAGVPGELVPLIEGAAGAFCPVRPGVLAGILKVESDYGRSQAAGVHSGANGSGAAGPMQFGIGGAAGHTWDGARQAGAVHPAPPAGADPGQYGYGVDANGDGLANVYDPADAIAAGARYLCALGVDHNEAAAIANYNCGSCGSSDPASWPAQTRNYVPAVLATAQAYQTPTPAAAAGAAGAPVPAGYGTPGPCGRSPATDYARSLVIATFGITNIGDCAYSGHVENSDHYPDRNGQAHALDVMVGANRPLGDQVAAWFAQRHQALNVKYVIWYGRIIDYRSANAAWHACQDPNSSCARNHFDHVHVSFLAGL